MYQQTIDFFFPLTEQIPLDLDYTACERPVVTSPIDYPGLPYILADTNSITTSLIASNLTLDIETTKVKLKEKPGFCRKTLLKCLGIQWEIK